MQNLRCSFRNTRTHPIFSIARMCFKKKLSSNTQSQGINFSSSLIFFTSQYFAPNKLQYKFVSNSAQAY